MYISSGVLEEPLPVGESLEVKIYIDSEQATPIDGAKLRIVPLSNSTVTQTSVTTQSDGSAIINFIASNGPKASFQVFASAEGYHDEQKTFEFSVKENRFKVNQDMEVLGLPEWAIYVGIAAIMLIVAVLVIFLKKPKQKTDDEEEIFEEEI